MNVGDRRLARLLNAFPEIVVVLDAQANVMWANHLAEELFDRPLESAIGTSAIDLVHPDDLEIVLRSLETIQSKTVGTPLEIRAKIGEDWRLIELIARPFPGSKKVPSSSAFVTSRNAGDSNWPVTMSRGSARWCTTRRPS
jgi:PAS domain S-box-containing protein